MKKRNIIIIAAIAAVIIVAAVLIFAKPAATSDSPDMTGKQPAEPTGTTEPLPEPITQTIVIDGDKEITATIGIEPTEEGAEDEQPGVTPTSTPEPGTTSEPQTTAEPTPVPQGTVLKYEEFYALSPEQMDAFRDSFGSMDDFYNWLVAAQEQFKKDHPDIVIGPGGAIDLTQLGK